MTRTPTGILLAARRAADAPGWRDEVRAALRVHRSAARAAPTLGIRQATLSRWLREEPALAEGITLRRAGSLPTHGRYVGARERRARGGGR